MDTGEFFYSSKEPSYIVMSEDGRAHYGRRPRVVELLVPMCCTKCEEKVRENMAELEGVQGVVVDPTMQRVTVTGFVDPMRALKKARKVKRDAQLLSGDHRHPVIPPSTSKHHHRSEYRYRPASAYQASPMVSSNRFVHHVQPASTYRASYSQRAPLASYAHQYVARPSYDDMVITNPRYLKHIEHDEYWQ